MKGLVGYTRTESHHPIAKVDGELMVRKGRPTNRKERRALKAVARKQGKKNG